MERRIIPSHSSQLLTFSNSSSTTSCHSTFGVHDTFRYGLNSIKAQITHGHSLERHLKNWDITQESLKMDMYSDIYGSHFPLRLKMEKLIVSQPKRIPVLPSSNFGASILSGKDDTIDVEDVLNRPDASTESMNVHGSMEYMLKMKV